MYDDLKGAYETLVFSDLLSCSVHQRYVFLGQALGSSVPRPLAHQLNTKISWASCSIACQFSLGGIGWISF